MTETNNATNSTPNRRALLINPRATYVDEIAQKCYPPMHLLYLAAALRKRGFEPTVLDANAFRMSDEEIAEEARRLAPALIGFSLYSEILAQARDLTRLARRACPSARVVLGGAHASALPERTLEQFPEADFVLAGEAEESLPLLCEAIVDSSKEALREIPGLFYRAERGVAEGPPARMPELSATALPARDLLERAYREKRYYSILVRSRPVDTIFTSRGCPFRCGFCYNTRFKYRARTAESVVDELVQIRDRGIRDVEFCDDTFTADRSRAMEIFDLIIREKLDISFRIKSRVDVFTEPLAKRAREAGVYLVAFGMESGSQRMLDAMEKRITVEQCARACDLTRRYGMLSHSSWIVGYPGETLESAEETVRFILKHHPSTVNLAALRPYPKTLAYETALATGDLMGDWGPDAQEAPWVRLPWAPERSVLDALCRKMLRRVYFTPHYAAAFAGRIARGANWTLARYAAQEARKAIGLKF